MSDTIKNRLRTTLFTPPRLREYENQFEICKSYVKQGTDRDGFEVKTVNEHVGKGLFATQKFYRGDFLLQYHGELLTYHEAQQREKKYPLRYGSFMFFFKHKGSSWCVDATFSPLKGRFINDGTGNERNAEVKCLEISGQPILAIFAVKDIQTNDEIRYDYGVKNLPWRRQQVKNDNEKKEGNSTVVAKPTAQKPSLKLGSTSGLYLKECKVLLTRENLHSISHSSDVCKQNTNEYIRSKILPLATLTKLNDVKKSDREEDIGYQQSIGNNSDDTSGTHKHNCLNDKTTTKERQKVFQDKYDEQHSNEDFNCDQISTVSSAHMTTDCECTCKTQKENEPTSSYVSTTTKTVLHQKTVLDEDENSKHPLLEAFLTKLTSKKIAQEAIRNQYVIQEKDVETQSDNVCSDEPGLFEDGVQNAARTFFTGDAWACIENTLHKNKAKFLAKESPELRISDESYSEPLENSDQFVGVSKRKISDTVFRVNKRTKYARNDQKVISYNNESLKPVQQNKSDVTCLSLKCNPFKASDTKGQNATSYAKASNGLQENDQACSSDKNHLNTECRTKDSCQMPGTGCSKTTQKEIELANASFSRTTKNMLHDQTSIEKYDNDKHRLIEVFIKELTSKAIAEEAIQNQYMIQEEDVETQPENVDFDVPGLFEDGIQLTARHYFTEDAWNCVQNILSEVHKRKGDILAMKIIKQPRDDNSKSPKDEPHAESRQMPVRSDFVCKGILDGKYERIKRHKKIERNKVKTTTCMNKSKKSNGRHKRDEGENNLSRMNGSEEVHQINQCKTNGIKPSIKTREFKQGCSYYQRANECSINEKLYRDKGCRKSLNYNSTLKESDGIRITQKEDGISNNFQSRTEKYTLQQMPSLNEGNNNTHTLVQTFLIKLTSKAIAEEAIQNHYTIQEEDVETQPENVVFDDPGLFENGVQETARGYFTDDAWEGVKNTLNEVHRHRDNIFAIKHMEQSGKLGNEQSLNLSNESHTEPLHPKTSDSECPAKVKQKKKPYRPCPYCNKFQSKLRLHLERKHAEEEEVKFALRLPKQDRDCAFNGIKKKGIMKKNLEIMGKPGMSPENLIRERSQGTPELVYCSQCYAFIRKRYFYRHKRTCYMTNDSTEIPQSMSSSICMEPGVSNDFKQDILNSFHEDQVGKLCRSDDLIVNYGKREYFKVELHKDKKDEKRTTLKSEMRRLGHLFLKFEEVCKEAGITDISSEDMFSRDKFHFLETSIISSCTKPDGTFKDGYKLGIGYLLKKVAKYIQGEYLIRKEDNKAEEIGRFLSVLQYHWITVFGDSEYAVKKHRQTHLRRPVQLPLEEDVKKLREFTIREIAKICNDKYAFIGSKEYVLLRDLLVCRLTLFNARRGGEPSRLLLNEWKDAMEGVWYDKKTLSTKDPTDKMLMGHYKLAYQPGKTNKLVPTLVIDDCWDAMNIIADPDIREQTGVPKSNIYMFPCTQLSKRHVSGWHCVKKCAELAQCNSKITATIRRHQVATLYAAQDVSPEDRKAFLLHMDHGEEINSNVYQSPPSVQETTRVGRFLQTLDSGVYKYFSH